MLRRWLLYIGTVVLGLATVGALLGAFVLALLYPTLPSLETLTDYRPKIPLRIVSAEGDLLGEFGEERRAVVNISRSPGRHEAGDPGSRGRALLFARRGRLSEHPAGRRVQSRIRDAAGSGDHHDAGRPQLLPHPREDDHPQAPRGHARLEDRGQPRQGRDPAALRQPDLPRTARLRVRRGVADLLRESAEGRHAGRSRDARRAAESALGVQPHQQPKTCENPAIVRSQANARPEVHH